MNKKSGIIIGVIIIFIIGAVIFNQKKTTSQGFNIGLISILSGDYAAVGENFKNGVVLAQEEYNKAHHDAQINLTIEDDGFNGGRGVSAYEKLKTTNHIDALINVSTPTIDSIYNRVTTDGLPVMQGGEQGIEPVADNVFGLFPDSIESEYQFGLYMKNRGVKKMTIVYTKHDAMIRFVKAFKRGFGGDTVDIAISPDEKDFRTHALKIVESKNQTIGFFIYPQQGAILISEYKKIAKDKAQLVFDTNLQSGFADYKRILADTNKLNGVWIGTSVLPTSEEFKTKYKDRFKTEYGFLADIGYDAFNILAQSYSPDKNQWVKNIKKINHLGVSGKIQFGPTDNRLPEAKMMTVVNGEIVDLK